MGNGRTQDNFLWLVSSPLIFLQIPRSVFIFIDGWLYCPYNPKVQMTEPLVYVVELVIRATKVLLKLYQFVNQLSFYAIHLENKVAVGLAKA